MVFNLGEENLSFYYHINQRSFLLQTKSKKFCKLMVSWIKASGFSRTVLLSSSHAYQRDDQQLLGYTTAIFRYHCPCSNIPPMMINPLLKVTGDRLKEMEWREMETVSTFPGVTDSEQRLYIPGGGATKGLFTDSCAEDIPLVVVLIFCSEGDNIPDAFTLLNHLNTWLHLVDAPAQMQPKWRIPASWRLLFGSGIPPALF
uniref:Proteasome (prosome, macropain) assembly chaperone 2 n=1 Tax=Hucho hucho TaxID=62062 RepID=A0A4W5KW20_9TELE